MYKVKTLPLNRRDFFGGKLPPLNGVSPYEWHPTADETQVIWDTLVTTTEDFDEVEFYLYIALHFLEKDYTDNYRKEVTSAMVLKAFHAFLES